MTRVEVAQQKQLVVEEGRHLQATLAQLTTEIKVVLQQETSPPSEAEASQSYLRYRARKLAAEIQSAETTSPPSIKQASGDRKRWTSYRRGAGDSQQTLDEAVDALVECSDTLANATSSKEDTFWCLDFALRTVSGALMLEEAALLAEAAISFAQSSLGASSSEATRIWLARFHVRQSQVFWDLADFHSSRTSVEIAVKIFRQCSGCTVDLVQALNALAQCHGAIDEAALELSISGEAVRLARSLDPEEHADILGTLLTTFAAALSVQGELQAAVATAEEAVELRRRLYAARPNLFREELAYSLSAFSTSLTNLGKYQQALSAAKESVLLRREGAKVRPEVFTKRLGWGLTRLASTQADLLDWEGSHMSAAEAVEIHRSARPKKVSSKQLAIAQEQAITACLELGYKVEARQRVEESLVVCLQLHKECRGPGLLRLPSLLIQLAELELESSPHGDASIVERLDQAAALLTEMDTSGLRCSALGTRLWWLSFADTLANRHESALRHAQAGHLFYQEDYQVPQGTKADALFNLRESLQRLRDCYEALNMENELRQTQEELARLPTRVEQAQRSADSTAADQRDIQVQIGETLLDAALPPPALSVDSPKDDVPTLGLVKGSPNHAPVIVPNKPAADALGGSLATAQ
jgi:tetratricopeptide (TPR) repeat protein